MDVKIWRTAPLSARLGLFVLAIYVVVALIAPWIAPYSETELVGRGYEPWSSQFLLGTDNLGRDMLSRILYGARNTMGYVFITTCLAFSVGVTLGLLAAALGGVLDQAISRAVDVVMAVPQLILALLFLTIIGNSAPVMISVIALIEATRVYRVTRATAMGIVVQDFVEAARLRGEGMGWILFKEVLPNAMPPLIAEFGLRFTHVFLFIASLSFLGLGVQPPTALWGAMVRESASLITFGVFTPLLPALAIGILAVSMNLVVDWVLDIQSGLQG